MRYRCCPHDHTHYATALRKHRQSGYLTWDNAPGQDVLIIQTQYGVDPLTFLEDICDSLSIHNFSLSDYTEVLPSVWVCFVSASDKARNGGCKLHGEASTYSVLSCQKNSDECKIYLPNNNAMIKYSYDIPLEVHIEVKKVTRTEGILRHREVDLGFYSISFRGDLTGYQNGSLCYQTNGFEIPITEEAASNGTIYVRTLSKPVLTPKNRGIKIIKEGS